MIDREHIEELLPPYLDGDLGPEEALAVERHLHACEGCAGMVSYLRRADAIVAGWPQAPRAMQPQLQRIDERVLPRIRRRGFLSSFPRMGGAPGYAGPAAFALVMVAVVAGLAAVLPRLRDGLQTGAPRGADEQQIAQVSAEFVTSAGAYLHERPVVPRSASFDTAARRARSYLAPGYRDGLAEFERLTAGGGDAGDTPLEWRGIELKGSTSDIQIQGDVATATVTAQVGDLTRRLLVTYRRVGGAWKITGLRPADATPRATPRADRGNAQLVTS